MRVGVFGHYGNQNLGDEAITTATIQHIKRRIPNVDIVGLSVKPEDTAKRYNIVSYPIRYVKPLSESPGGKVIELQSSEVTEIDSNSNRAGLKDRLKKIPILGAVLKGIAHTPYLLRKWRQEFAFLAESRRNLKGIDLIIVAGSNQFLDNFGGTWGFPYTLLKWTILCKLTNTRIAFASIGAGPLEAPLSKLLVRTALVFSDYLSYRDIASKQLVENTIFPIHGKVYPDLAHSLLFETEVKNEDRPAGKPVVAINPMPIYDSRYWCEHDEGRYKAYVKKMSEFCDFLMKEGYPVQFFSTQPTDENVIADILNGINQDLLAGIDKECLIQRSREVAELMTYLDSVDIVVATRLHGTILSLLAEKPVLGVTYHRKSSDVLTQMEQKDYFVSLDNFDSSTLKSRFDILVENMGDETRKISQYGKEYRLKLDQQYEEICDLVR